MENLADYVKKTGRQVYLVPVSLSYTIVPEDVDIEASRTGKNISEKDIFAQLAVLDKQYAKLPDSAIHVRFSAPIAYGPESGGIGDTVDRLMEAIGRGVVRPYTSMLARAVVSLCDPDRSWYRSSCCSRCDRQPRQSVPPSSPPRPGRSQPGFP